MGLAGVGWRGGEKMQTTVIEQQYKKCLIKKKNYVVMSISTLKKIEKIQYPFLVLKKPLNKIDIEGTYINKIKTTYEKPAVNIIVNGEKLKAFP